MMSSDFLPYRSKERYLRYIRVARLCLNHETLLAFVTRANGKFEGDVPFALHYVDGSTLLEVSSSSFTFLLNAAWSVLMNNKEMSKFSLQRLFNAGIHVLKILRSVFGDMPEENRKVVGV